MDKLNSELIRTKKIKLCVGCFLLISTFSYTSYGKSREGLSETMQAKLIRSLEDYVSLSSKEYKE